MKKQASSVPNSPAINPDSLLSDEQVHQGGKAPHTSGLAHTVDGADRILGKRERLLRAGSVTLLSHVPGGSVGGFGHGNDTAIAFPVCQKENGGKEKKAIDVQVQCNYNALHSTKPMPKKNSAAPALDDSQKPPSQKNRTRQTKTCTPRLDLWTWGVEFFKHTRYRNISRFIDAKLAGHARLTRKVSKGLGIPVPNTEVEA